MRDALGLADDANFEFTTDDGGGDGGCDQFLWGNGRNVSVKDGQVGQFAGGE